jgi:hypothetical protein
MSQDLAELEAQFKTKIPCFQSVQWADQSIYLLRIKLRKPEWSDTLICLLYVTDELLEEPAMLALIIEQKIAAELPI